jgi:GTP cyclohydrolase I
VTDDYHNAIPQLAAALEALGFTDDPEMEATAERVAQFLGEFRAQSIPTTTPLSTRSDNPVVIRDLQYHSLCAHHLLPFFGTCTIAYRPAGAIAGLGWFPRLVATLARRPQLQERLVEQIAEAVFQTLQPQSVAVYMNARQMCVEMRGARSQGQFEVTATAGLPDPEMAALVRPR